MNSIQDLVKSVLESDKILSEKFPANSPHHSEKKNEESEKIMNNLFALCRNVKGLKLSSVQQEMRDNNAPLFLFVAKTDEEIAEKKEARRKEQEETRRKKMEGMTEKEREEAQAREKEEAEIKGKEEEALEEAKRKNKSNVTLKFPEGKEGYRDVKHCLYIVPRRPLIANIEGMSFDHVKNDWLEQRRLIFQEDQDKLSRLSKDYDKNQEFLDDAGFEVEDDQEEDDAYYQGQLIHYIIQHRANADDNDEQLPPKVWSVINKKDFDQLKAVMDSNTNLSSKFRACNLVLEWLDEENHVAHRYDHPNIPPLGSTPQEEGKTGEGATLPS